MINIKKNQYLVILLCFCMTLLLFGCSNNSEDTSMFKVKASSDKETVKVDEPFTITADVSYGNQDISDDKVVEIEFIDNGTSIGSTNPKYLGNGKYKLEMKFLTPGEHIIVVHASYKDNYLTDFITYNISE